MTRAMRSKSAQPSAFDPCNVCFDVKEGEVYKGTIKPVSTAQNVSTFYDFGSASYQGDAVVPALDDKLIVFFHQDNSTFSCDTSIVFVVNKYIAGSGGGGGFHGNLTMTVTGNFDASNLAVADDYNPNGDSYTYNGQETTIFWTYALRRTDGLARTYSSIPESINVTVDDYFNVAIDDVRAVSGEGVSAASPADSTNNSIYIPLNLTAASLTLERKTCA